MHLGNAPGSAKLSRTETNRANAQHSTGPRTLEGKARSSSNSFRHGLYSKQLIIPGEDPAEFDHLRTTLRAEHGPANTVEEILVDELAQHFWRMRRFRLLEAQAFSPDNLDGWLESGLASLVQRSLASAERSFHRSLTALRQLQQDRSRAIATSTQLPGPEFSPATPETQSAKALGLPRRGFVPLKAAPTLSQERWNDLPAHLPNPNRKAA